MPSMTNGLEHDQNDTESFGDQLKRPAILENFTAINADMSFETS